MTYKAMRCVEALRACDLHKNIQPVAFFVCGDCPGYEPDTTCRMNLIAADLIESLSAELEQVKAERDAAVKQLKEVDAEGLYCSHCKHDALCEGPIHLDCRDCERESCPCHTCANNCNWQWRGVQEYGVGADNETR